MGYLTKPVRQSELREAILKAIRTNGTPEAWPHAPAEPGGDEHSRGLHILVAEDNPVNQQLARRLLEKRGHTVVLANDGHEVLRIIDEDEFDVVLMDVQMPGMDGLEATAEIRRRETQSGKHQTIVAMTAHAMKGDQERCLAAGMDGYLTKPIRSEELDTLLQTILARRAEIKDILEVAENNK